MHADEFNELMASQTEDEQRDILGEMEITARLMITGVEEKEDARLTRADRSAIRQCISTLQKSVWPNNDHTAIVITEHHDGDFGQIWPEHPLATGIETVAVDQRENRTGLSDHGCAHCESKQLSPHKKAHPLKNLFPDAPH